MDKLQEYAKAIVAVLVAFIIAVQVALEVGNNINDWITVLIAFVGAGAVYAVPNRTNSGE
jgi:uncharacterized membrane protein